MPQYIFLSEKPLSLQMGSKLVPKFFPGFNAQITLNGFAGDITFGNASFLAGGNKLPFEGIRNSER